MEKRDKNLEVAVVGMAARLPGAKNIGEFWENLKNGVESISAYSEKEWARVGLPDPQIEKNLNFNKAKGILDGADLFDAEFFGYTAKEAGQMDPQIRVFHEVAWEAIENAGYNIHDLKKENKKTGLYACAKMNFSWYAAGLKVVGSMNERFEFNKLWDKDFMATRIAYKLGLTGPAVVVDSACSTSLVAVHLASRALITGECDIALAGGVNITTAKGYVYEAGLLFSKSGHCHVFDAKADGTVFSDGAGIVVLKRLKDAINDGDNILAIIKGSAINNDGDQKNGYMAPAISGQREVITAALNFSQVSPETITYVEAHGTGTKLGDPIEVEALSQAFNTKKHQYCGIGSVKSNVGHLSVAAGVVGLIKTVLCLQNRLIPASLNYQRANPQINFKNSPFYVVKNNISWRRLEAQIPLRAGVSSFGIGGTNAHVILEESPAKKRKLNHDERGQLLLVSAKTKNALDEAIINLADYLQKNPNINLADVAWTLQVGRAEFKYRKSWVCSNDIKETVKLIKKAKERSASEYSGERKRLVFMFPGQSSQYINMGRDLYQKEKIFREKINSGFILAKKISGIDYKKIIYPKTKKERKEAELKINDIIYSQPILFVFEYAMAMLLVGQGMKPDYFLGHSLGEYVAACLAGVLSEKDALKLVIKRACLIKDKVSAGAMLAVSISLEKLRPILKKINSEKNLGALEISANNSPTLQMVSGSEKAINKLEETLAKENYQYRRLKVNRPLHSSQLKGMTGKLKKFIEKEISLNKPKIPYVSSLTGKFVSDQQVLNASYWTDQITNGVAFNQAIKTLLKKEKNLVLIELGPGNDLTTFVRQETKINPDQIPMSLIKRANEAMSDYEYYLSQLGYLWSMGISINWKKVFQEKNRQKISLPTYPFERQSYWMEKEDTGGLINDTFLQSHSDNLRPTENLINKQFKEPVLISKPDISDWFYIPDWQVASHNFNDSPDVFIKQKYLVFLPINKKARVLIKNLLTKLKASQNKIILVEPGNNFKQKNNEHYLINFKSKRDYNLLIDQLIKNNILPSNIIHFGNFGNDDNQKNITIEKFDRVQDGGLFSLIYLVQSLAEVNYNQEIKLSLVVDNLFKIEEKDLISPAKATLLGPVKVIPKEQTNIKCRIIDIKPEEIIGDCKNIINELNGQKLDAIVALRGDQRYIQSFKPIKIKEEKTDKNEATIKEGGTYLILGGLGGVGYSLAQYLAKNYQAELIIVGRKKLLTDKQGKIISGGVDKKTPVSILEKLSQVKQLAKLGSQVRYFGVDIGNLTKFAEVLREINRHHPNIIGVIHAAGEIDGAGIIQRREKQNIDQQLTIKARASILIDQIIKPGFIIYCSSISSIAAPFGEVAYVAANNFLDSFAKSYSSQNKTKRLAINWPGWQEVGMAEEAKRRRTNFKPNQLLDSCLINTAEIKIYETIIDQKRHPLLNDHKLFEKYPMAPGTFFISLIYSASQFFAGQSIIEINNLTLVQPLILLNKQARRKIRIVFVRDKNGNASTWSLSIISQKNTDFESWEEHCHGKLVIPKNNNQGLEKYNIGKLVKELKKKGAKERIKPKTQSNNLLKFGPRWESAQKIIFNSKTSVAFLELPPKFSQEASHYGVHPSLFDRATKKELFVLDKGTEKDLPIAYGKIKIYRPELGNKINSVVRLKDYYKKNQLITSTTEVNIFDQEGRRLIHMENVINRRTTVKIFKENIFETINEKDKKIVNLSLTTTKAGVLDNLVFINKKRSAPGPKEIEVETKYTALNFRDVLLALNKLRSNNRQVEFGFECAGIVKRVGGLVKDIKIGDEVVVLRQNIFFEYLIVPREQVILKPQNLTLADACSVFVAFYTAYCGILSCARAKSGQSILIHSAAGGVGLAAVQIAKWLGLKIFATAGSEEKRSFLKYLGVDYVFDSRTINFFQEIKKITNNQGVDIVLNSTSGEIKKKSAEALATGGHFIEIGMGKNNFQKEVKKILKPKKAQYHFVLMIGKRGLEKRRVIYREIIDNFKKGVFKPLPYKIFNLSDVKEAFSFMSQAKHIGKVLVFWKDKEIIRQKLTDSLQTSFNTNDFLSFIIDRWPGLKKLGHELEQLRGLSLSINPDQGQIIANRLLGSIASNDFFEISDQKKDELIPGQIIISKISPDDLYGEKKDEEPASGKLISGSVLNYERPTEEPLALNNDQEKIIFIWKELFGDSKINITDNFFDLGGDSLKAVQVVNKINQSLDANISVTTIFKQPTIKELLSVIKENRKNNYAKKKQIIRKVKQPKKYRLD